MANAIKPASFVDDPLDGEDELNIPFGVLTARWDADILDTAGVAPGTIIGADDPFTVRFRVELIGSLWQCLCGDWCFDLGFSPIGSGTGFDLSERIPDPSKLKYPGWEGCQTQWIELVVDVPANVIPAAGCAGTVYEIAAKFALRCCSGHVALTGMEALEEYQFYGRHNP